MQGLLTTVGGSNSVRRTATAVPYDTSGEIADFVRKSTNPYNLAILWIGQSVNHRPTD